MAAIITTLTLAFGASQASPSRSELVDPPTGTPAAQGPGCSYALAEVPPDAGEIRVYFNNRPAEIPNNARNGWTYSAASNSVSFHGASCEAIKSGKVVDIDIVCGCDPLRSTRARLAGAVTRARA